jgi:hypothetical protein
MQLDRYLVDLPGKTKRYLVVVGNRRPDVDTDVEVLVFRRSSSPPKLKREIAVGRKAPTGVLAAVL